MLDTTSSRGAGGDGVAPSRPVAFVAAIAIAAAVLLLRWTLNPLLEDQAPFLVLLIAPRPGSASGRAWSPPWSARSPAR